MVLERLQEAAKEIELSNLQETLEEAEKLLVSLGEKISQNEYSFVKESLQSRAIPPPKLLIKDHKEANKDGPFLTRLIVPATNFTAAFPKLGYLGIENILDAAGVDYARKTIRQASELKEVLEKLGIDRELYTVVSFDAIAMYPSITLKMVRKAVEYF